MPEPIVPSQKASTSSSVDAGRRERVAGGVDEQVVGALVPVLAERRAAHADDGDPVADPVRCHVSPPRRPSERTCLPEVIVHAVGGEQTAERHLDPVADRDRRRVDVGELALEAAAAVEVDDRGHHRRAEASRPAGRRCRWRWWPGTSAMRSGAMLVDGAAAHAHPRRRQVDGRRSLAAAADERRTSTPRCAGDGGAAGRVGSGRRGGSRCEEAAPGEERGYGRSSRPAAICSATGRRAAGSRRARRSCAAATTSAPSASCDHGDASGPARPGRARRRACSPAWAAPVLPTGAVRSSTSASGRHPTPCAARVDRARGAARRRSAWSTSSAAMPGRLSAVGRRASSASGT